jgi:mycofactocin precursor peptide peptidase
VNRALADLASPEIGSAAAPALLVVPLGATEQHGPHLPLSTDSEIAVALARELVANRPAAVLAPSLSYGSSGEHEGFPGTISIGAAALELTLVELCRSASASFGRILLLSAHGGNAEPLAAAVACLRSEGREVRAWSPDWGGDAHAGRTETSLMLALAPGRVRLDRAAAGNRAPLAELLPRLRSGGMRAVAANGVLGDPGGASAEEGRALFDAAVAELLAAADAWCGEHA